MENFSERLRFALFKLDLSQSEAARRCGISQQAMNYIIKNQLGSSKLASQIADGLGINPEWLIFGKGRYQSVQIVSLPIFKDYFSLNAFLNGVKIQEDEHCITDRDYGRSAFAFKVAANRLAICCASEIKTEDIFVGEYLIVLPETYRISSVRKENSYSICEWRIFNVIL